MRPIKCGPCVPLCSKIRNYQENHSELTIKHISHHQFCNLVYRRQDHLSAQHLATRSDEFLEYSSLKSQKRVQNFSSEPNTQHQFVIRWNIFFYLFCIFAINFPHFCVKTSISRRAACGKNNNYSKLFTNYQGNITNDQRYLTDSSH